jgi:hypothetical protein
VHVGSSIIASQIVGLCRGYAKSFVSNIGMMMLKIDRHIDTML